MGRGLFILFFLIPFFSIGQEVHRLAGTVQPVGREFSSYFIRFTVKDTKVSGYSITNYKSGNKLRASLTGKLSPASELYIEETGTLDGPPGEGQALCYFRAHLKLSIANGRQRWTGPYESLQVNGVSCESGTMILMDELPEVIEAPKPKPAVIKPIVTAPKTIPIDTPKVTPPVLPKDTPKVLAPKPAPKPVIIINRPEKRQVEAATVSFDSNACMRSYVWSGDSLSVVVWDGFTTDGDVVSLSINGEHALDHVRLSEKQIQINRVLKKGANTLMLYLHDEGYEPPNTPNIILYDGAKKYDLAVSGSSGDKVRICIEH